MFSKDTPFQHALTGVPGALRMALKERSLDQPGVLVAFIQDVLEDGMAASSVVDTGIPTISIGGIDSIVPLSSPSSSSLLHAAPSASPPLLPPVSHVSPSHCKPVEKPIRSRKGGKVRGGKKELMEGIVEERRELAKEFRDMLVEKREEWLILECSATLVGLRGVSRRCRGRRRIWTFRRRFRHPLKVLKTLIFANFRKISKVPGYPPG